MRFKTMDSSSVDICVEEYEDLRLQSANVMSYHCR
jgi:hypothetical protein